MSQSGVVFDIERFATADGPGIRTAVFLKGCNMRCGWCHNPEGLAGAPEIMYDASRCVCCGFCAQVCAAHAHSMTEGRHVFDRLKCARCFRCAGVCCSGALEKAGVTRHADELADELAFDEPYFRASGGGVTVSGGEPLCQPVFTLELLAAISKRGIHTALETNLSAAWPRIRELLPHLDLIMFDIKHIDAEAHLRFTGVALERILENASLLALEDIPVIIRTPVVAGVNDRPHVVGGIAKYIKAHFQKNLQYYELLTYHPLGTAKAARLGMTDRSSPMQTLTADEMRALALAGVSEGIPVYMDGSEVK